MTAIQNVLKNPETPIDSSSGKRNKSEVYENEFLKFEIARYINTLHEQKKHFTLEDLFYYAKLNLEYEHGQTTLYKIIRQMGYKYKKIDNRKA